MLPFQYKPKFIMSGDRTKQQLVAFKGLQSPDKLSIGKMGDNKVMITGLQPDTFYPAGTYSVAYYSDQGNGSARMQLPAFRTKPVIMESFDINVGKEIEGTEGEVKPVIPGNYNPYNTSNTNVKAESKDENIAFAKYNNQLGVYEINFVKAGETDIVFTALDGGNAQSTLHVEVREKPKSPENAIVKANSKSVIITVD